MVKDFPSLSIRKAASAVGVSPTLAYPINKHNNRLWNESRSFEGIEMSLHDEKVLFWCAISAEGIIGPYFFEESVNKDNYLKMLKIFFLRICMYNVQKVQTTTFNKMVL